MSSTAMAQLKKLFAVVLTVVFASTFTDAGVGFSSYNIANGGAFAIAASNVAGSRVNGTGIRVAYKFYAGFTSPITAIDAEVTTGGTVTGIKMIMGIYADNGDIPGVQLGGSTASTAIPAVGNHAIGLSSLASNTGALTLNTPYWLVLDYDTGATAPTTSNFFTIPYTGVQLQGEKIRQFNGSDWTTIGPTLFGGNFILEDTNGNFHGVMMTASGTISSKTAIFSGNRQGWKMRVGVPQNISAVSFKIRKTASPPQNLEGSLYIGSSFKETVTYSSSSIVTSGTSDSVNTMIFSQTYTAPANTDVYFIFDQASDGGTSGNSYALWTNRPNPTYINYMYDANNRMVTGNPGTGVVPSALDPTTLTVATDEVPLSTSFNFSSPQTDIFVPPHSSVGN